MRSSCFCLNLVSVLSSLVFNVSRMPAVLANELKPTVFRLRKMIVFALGIAILIHFCLLAQNVHAILVSNLSPSYSQDFDSLASTGTSSTVPAGWAFSESGTTNANSTYTASNGSDSADATYSFGAAGSSERAFGTLTNGIFTSIIGASFINSLSSISAIESVAISYTGEQWRLGSPNRVDQIDFQYSIDATSLSTGTWIDVDALDFTTPNTQTGGAKDGNNSENRKSLNSSISFASPIAPGSGFMIRWTDINASGSDDGLAVDDFSLTATFATVPEPSAFLFGSLISVVLGTGYIRRRLKEQYCRNQ